MTTKTTTGPSRVRAALAELLSERPGQWVSREDVCERLGYKVSPQIVSRMARELGCESALGRLGGYRHDNVVPPARRPVPAAPTADSRFYPEVPW
jgi:hypothetical protein